MSRFTVFFTGFLYIFSGILAEKDNKKVSWTSEEHQKEPPDYSPKLTTKWVWPWNKTPTVTTGTVPVTTTTTATTAKPTTTPLPVYILKAAARKGLRTGLRGVAPEKRKKQLKNMGKKIKVKRISKNASKTLHNGYRKVNITQSPPAMDMFEINEKAGLNDYLFQGDINLDNNQISMLSSTDETSGRKKRQILNSANFWIGKTVYYYFDSGLSTYMQQIVLDAIDFLQSRTCIRFNQSSTATNRVKIINGVGCYSSVGMLGGEQTLSLGSGCDVLGTAAHELSHTLGVFHTQMRYDRDDFVTIDLTDVDSSYDANFAKLSSSASTNLITYEYGSFMHYGGRSFVNSGGVDSIVPKEPLMVYTMGGRIVTFLDIYMLNKHYSCSCSTTLDCKNGGYPNPANCSTCLCPYSFGGTLCDQKANYTCGSILTATSTWQQEQFTFGNSSNSATARPSCIYCNYWITAPTGKSIQFRIDSTYNTQCGYGCTFNGIEPKLKIDQTMTQTRYCCDEFNSEIMTSEVNPLPVFAYNRYYITKYTFSYRYVNSNTTTCTNIADNTTCTALKASYDQGCTLYDIAQLKVLCAASMDLCGKATSVDCADRFPTEKCSKYSSAGLCTSQPPLVAEFSCAATCGFCINPV